MRRIERQEKENKVFKPKFQLGSSLIYPPSYRKRRIMFLAKTVNHIFDFQIVVSPWQEDQIENYETYEIALSVLVPHPINNFKPHAEEFWRGNISDSNYRYVQHCITQEHELGFRAGLTVHYARGTWSSWPPHPFEVENLARPKPIPFHEQFAIFTNPPGGWALQMIRGHEKTKIHVRRDRDIVDIPLSAHPIVAAPGYQLAYFWAYSCDPMQEKN